MAKFTPEQQVQAELNKAVNDFHLMKKYHGEDSKEAMAAEHRVHALTRKLPKGKGVGSNWRNPGVS